MPELRDQAKHLCNVLRKANLPVLDCSERNGGRSLAKQLHHLDSIAVPYCLLLRDQCLQNGLFRVRYRVTTLGFTRIFIENSNKLSLINTNTRKRKLRRNRTGIVSR
uniref:(northern house mosquito) hypothetical protein n=1 Tax=Culex pipiens TaxID=7175 RepID=A0A8D8AGK8_CULPI